jgi:hypothetical protein
MPAPPTCHQLEGRRRAIGSQHLQAAQFLSSIPGMLLQRLAKWN